MGTPSNGNANSKEDKPSSCNKKLTQPASIIASSGENTLGDCSNAPMEIPQEDHAVEEALNPLERDTKGADSAPVKPLEPPDATRETYTVPSYARNDQDTKDIDSYFSAKKLPPSNLQIRAAIGTALGAAAAHAKLIADQEEREMEHLISIVIENQLKKLHYKIQHFDELEDIMEKEHALMEQTKELLLAERLRIVQKMLGSKSSGSR